METSTETAKRLCKSRRNRFIDGVCGGIAEYFGVDPTIVRLLWVLITLMGGTGFVLYILAMIIMPVNPEHIAVPSPVSTTTKSADKRRFFGVLMILIGAIILLTNLGWLAEFSWWSFSRTVMLPILLIFLGVLFIYIHTTKKVGPAPSTADPSFGNVPPSPAGIKELRRSMTDRKLFGVCSGVAKYFTIDPTIVRFLFVFLVLASFGWGALLYIILGFIMPEEKPTTSSL